MTTTTRPRRSLRDLLKSKYKSPEDLLERLGFTADEFLPAMAFDSKFGLGTSTMTAPQVRAKDVLSKQMRRSIDQMSSTMRQALRQHLSKDDLHQPDLHLHVGQHGARDQEAGSGSYLSPAVAAALWRLIAPKLDDTDSQEDFHALLQQLCGQSDFHEIADDQLPLLGALGGLGEAAAGAGEAAAGLGEAGEGALIGGALGASGGGGKEDDDDCRGKDQSFTAPGPRNFGSMPKPGGSMSPPRPFPPDTSRQRGAMDSKQKAAFDSAFPEAARIRVLDVPSLYRDGTPVHEPYRLPRARRLPASLAMDKATLKAEKRANKAFAREFPMTTRIKVL